MLRADRDPQPQHSEQRRQPPDLPPDRQQQRAELCSSSNPEPQYEQDSTDGGSPGRSHNSHWRNAEVPEYEDPVEGPIYQVGSDDGADDRPGPPHGLEALPKDHEQ